MEDSDNFSTTRMNKPIYGITLFFILGIIIGRYLTLPFIPLYLGLAVLFVLTFVLYLKKREKWTGYSLFLITLLIGIVYFYYIYYPHSSNHIVGYAPSQEKVSIVGRVVSRPQLRERRIRFIVEAQKVITEGEEGQEKTTQGRIWVVRVIEHTLPEPYSLVLKGIMLGDKESLPLAVQESFLRTGTGQAVPVQLG